MLREALSAADQTGLVASRAANVISGGARTRATLHQVRAEQVTVPSGVVRVFAESQAVLPLRVALGTANGVVRTPTAKGRGRSRRRCRSSRRRTCRRPARGGLRRCGRREARLGGTGLRSGRHLRVGIEQPQRHDEAEREVSPHDHATLEQRGGGVKVYVMRELARRTTRF
jgi:hypothetical protein